MQYKQLSISMKKTYFRNPLPQLITFPFSVTFVIVAVVNIPLCTYILTTNHHDIYILLIKEDLILLPLIIHTSVVVKRCHHVDSPFKLNELKCFLPAIIQALLLHSIKLKHDDDSIAVRKPNLALMKWMTRIEWIDSNTLENMIKHGYPTVRHCVRVRALNDRSTIPVINVLVLINSQRLLPSALQLSLSLLLILIKQWLSDN